MTNTIPGAKQYPLFYAQAAKLTLLQAPNSVRLAGRTSLNISNYVIRLALEKDVSGASQLAWTLNSVTLYASNVGMLVGNLSWHDL